MGEVSSKGKINVQFINTFWNLEGIFELIQTITVSKNPKCWNIIENVVDYIKTKFSRVEDSNELYRMKLLNEELK